MTGFVGVHIGAGSHSIKLQNDYEKICKIACKKGVEALKCGKNAVDAVAIATAALEDYPLTNAGHGSNLTWDGDVECDASIMDGEKLGFGAVGAVSKIKNPIFAAKSLCLAQYEQLPLNRVPPCLLVSSGAEKWAKEREIEIIDPKALITSKALSAYKKYKRKAEASSTNKEKEVDSVTNGLLDTVGAVALDNEGRVAASCSSGGILLKHPGRVGQAAIYGCGCWAQNFPCGRGLAVSVTGCGEDLMRTCLARETVNSLYSSLQTTSAINNSLRTFIESPFLGVHSQKLGGVIALDTDKSGRGEFIWGHTTASMAVGFMSTTDRHPQSRISRLPKGMQPGSSVIIEGIPC